MKLFKIVLISFALTLATQSVMATQSICIPVVIAGALSMLWGAIVAKQFRSDSLWKKVLIINIGFWLLIIFVLVKFIFYRKSGILHPGLYLFIPLVWFTGSWVVLRRIQWLYILHVALVSLCAFVLIPLIFISMAVKHVHVPIPDAVEFAKENGQSYDLEAISRMRLIELTNTGCGVCILQHRKMQKVLKGTPELNRWLILNNSFDRNTPAIWQHFRKYSPGIVAEYVYDTGGQFTRALVGKDTAVPYLAVLGTDGSVYSIIVGYNRDIGPYWFRYLLRRELAYAAAQSR